MTDDQPDDQPDEQLDELPADQPDEQPDEDATGEPDEEQGARRLRNLAAALSELDDASIRRGVATMREQSRNEVAQHLQLSKASMHLGDALPPLLRRKVRTVPPSRQLSVAFALSEEVNDEAIALLGENSEDPTRAQVDEVLPTLIESQGLPIVRLMIAAYASSDARCQAVMGEVLDADERFVLPDLAPVDASEPEEVASITTFTRDANDPAQAAKREQRKAAKAAKKDAEARKKEAAATAEAARRQAVHQANQSKSRKS